MHTDGAFHSLHQSFRKFVSTILCILYSLETINLLFVYYFTNFTNFNRVPKFSLLHFFPLFTLWIVLFFVFIKIHANVFLLTKCWLKGFLKVKMALCIFKTVFMFCGMKSLSKHLRCRYHRSVTSEFSRIIRFWHKVNSLTASGCFSSSVCHVVLPFRSSNASYSRLE